jgi:hypothetical protein
VVGAAKVGGRADSLLMWQVLRPVADENGAAASPPGKDAVAQTPKRSPGRASEPRPTPKSARVRHMTPVSAATPLWTRTDEKAPQMKITTPRVTLHKFFTAAEPVGPAAVSAVPPIPLAPASVLVPVPAVEVLANPATPPPTATSVEQEATEWEHAADDAVEPPAAEPTAAEPARARRRRPRPKWFEGTVADAALDNAAALPDGVAVAIPCDPAGTYVVSVDTWPALLMVAEFLASYGGPLGLGRRQLTLGARAKAGQILRWVYGVLTVLACMGSLTDELEGELCNRRPLQLLPTVHVALLKGDARSAGACAAVLTSAMP